MSARFLLDDVCLWCARLFAGFNVLISVYGTWLSTTPTRLAHWQMLDSLRACEITSILALSCLWLISVWTLRNNTSRWLIGLSVPLYLLLVCWSLARGYGFFDLTEAIFTVVTLVGLSSMLWVAVRPPIFEQIPA